MADFTATAEARALMPTLKTSFQDAAFAQANELVDAGQSPKEAGSIVANIMIEAAWLVAGCGVVADGGTPNKDNFRAAVEVALERITFRDPAEPSSDTKGQADE